MTPRSSMSFVTCIAIGLLLQSGARADLVRLKNGGELRGALVKGSDTAHDPEVTITALSGGRVYSILHCSIISLQQLSHIL